MSSEQKTGDNKRGARWKYFLTAAVIAGLFCLWLFLPVDEWLKSASEKIESWGNWALLAAILVYSLGVPLMVPGTALTIPAGLIFGLGRGFLVVMIGAPIGASISFLVGRYWARRWVQQKLQDYPKFKALDGAVKQEGWKVVLLVRLSPLVPFNIQNYFFGVTDVSFRSFLLASVVGMAPGTLLYVYIGALGNAASGEQPSALKWTFFGLGLVATLAVAMLLARKAKAVMESDAEIQSPVETAK